MPGPVEEVCSQCIGARLAGQLKEGQGPRRQNAQEGRALENSFVPAHTKIPLRGPASDLPVSSYPYVKAILRVEETEGWEPFLQPSLYLRVKNINYANKHKAFFSCQHTNPVTLCIHLRSRSLPTKTRPRFLPDFPVSTFVNICCP